eukprot:TRINITY_DN2031_c0_g1_i1.p1 TRINITY_DN2031_c0_g1~~TRINITY_DN2031_c0_g1_i1.p1  ORF type:complete len:100 (-),score=14.66 TRINITY_DN2031_c0_g1_i1:99-398(-)
MWVKDIQEFDSSIPFVLVGTQIDLRQDKKKQAELAQKGKAPVAYEKGIEKQRTIGAYCYVECSALTRLNLNRVFSDSVSAILTKKQSQTSENGCCCTLL